MKYFQKLRGDRVYLSPISSDDYEVYTKWMNDSVVTDRLGNTWVLYDVDKEKEFLGTALKTEYHFSIVKYDCDQLLGNVSLINLNYINQTAEFGIFIGEGTERGKGYGSEAGRLMLDYGFNALHLNNIMLRSFDFNINAISCYEKLGFKTMGIRRRAYFSGGEFHDEIYMDMLSEEFRL